MAIIRYLPFILFFLVSFSLYVEARTWTAAGYKVEAEFVSFDEKLNVVAIKGDNNKMFDVKFDRLSKEDQEYVKKQLQSQSRGDENPFALRSADNKSQLERIRYALLVGVNEYEQLHSLRFACNDVNYLAEQLKKAGYEEDNVIVVCDTAGKTSLTPTKKNIERELNRLISKTNENDQFFFVFCGHGLNIGNKAYLAPYEIQLPESPEDADAIETLISVDWLYDKLAECPARIKLLFLDACQEELFGSRAIREKSSVQQLDAKEFQNRKVVKNLIQFYACSPGEFSHESATLSHGVYSYFLAKGVGGEADLDNDGNIDVKELDKYACDNTLRYVRDELKKAKQTPQYFGDLRANPRIATLKDKKLRQQLSEDFRAFALGVDSQEDFVVKFLSANAPSKITLWKDGADKGIVEGEYLYGLCLLYGVSVEKSLSKAVEFFRKAAEQGNAYAQFNLGNCYYNGDGVVRDQEVAISWYRKSAEQEYSAAKSFITNIDNNAKIKSEQREKEQAEKERIEKEQAEKERIEKERAKDEELERLRKELVRAREEELERLRKEKDEYEKNKNKNSGNTSSQSSNNNNTNSNNGNTSNNYNYPSTGWTDMGTINGAQVYRDNSAKKEWTVVLGQVRSAENGSSARSKVAALGFRLPSFRELQQMESNGGRRYLNVGNGYYETNDPSILGNPATNGFRTPQKRTGLGRNYYIGVRQSR